MIAAIIINTVLSCIIYAAFAGKMQFYKHFNDTYNYMLHYGKHADKKNLIDIFFNQDKGWWVLAGFIPVAALAMVLAHCCLRFRPFRILILKAT